MTVGPLSVVRCAEGTSMKPHTLMLGDALIACISDHEATRIEAQLAGGTLRVVDVGGTGLPRWPDLTELRDALDTADRFDDPMDLSTGGGFATLDVVEAARRLCYPDTPIESEIL